MTEATTFASLFEVDAVLLTVVKNAASLCGDNSFIAIPAAA
jgi:hypothetical protein